MWIKDLEETQTSFSKEYLKVNDNIDVFRIQSGIEYNFSVIQDVLLNKVTKEGGLNKYGINLDGDVANTIKKKWGVTQTFTHNIASGNRYYTVGCPRFQSWCPMCYENLKAKQNASGDKSYKSPYPISKKVFALVYNHNTSEIGVLPFNNTMLDNMSSLVDLGDLYAGHFKMSRTGKGRYTKYKLSINMSVDEKLEDTIINKFKETHYNSEWKPDFDKKIVPSEECVKAITGIDVRQHYINNKKLGFITEVSGWGLPVGYNGEAEQSEQTNDNPLITPESTEPDGDVPFEPPSDNIPSFVNTINDMAKSLTNENTVFLTNNNEDINLDMLCQQQSDVIMFFQSLIATGSDHKNEAIIFLGIAGVLDNNKGAVLTDPQGIGDKITNKVIIPFITWWTKNARGQ